MDNKQRPGRHGVPVGVFERVVPKHLLELINRSIDATRDEWRPPDGRRASAQARQFVELLRTTDAFVAMERQARDGALRWAAGELGRELGGEPFCVLRCVNRDMAAQSYLRHFDSHVLTVLVPLQTVQADERSGNGNGDLIVCLEQRHDISPLGHAVLKSWLFLEHRFPFFIRRVLIALDGHRRRYERIRCVPGNAYVFNGFITQHHNLHVASGERRSLIIHYYDPGLAAGARSVMRTLRTVRDRMGDRV